MLSHGSPRKVTQHGSRNMWSVGLEIISLPFIQIKDILVFIKCNDDI